MPAKRQTVEEQFTCFFLSDRRDWKPDTQLKVNMKKLTTQYPDRDEISWFKYFHQEVKIKSCPLARRHLLAYIEEVYHLCAYRVQKKLQHIFRNHKPDYVEEARSLAYKQDFWKNYTPSSGTPNQYAYRKLELSLKEKLFADRKDKAASDYGLLTRTSRKRLEQIFKEDGFKDSQLSEYLLVFMMCKKIRADLTKIHGVIQEPTSEQFEDILHQCQATGAANVSLEKVKAILKSCIKILRSRKEIIEIEYSDGIGNRLIIEDDRWESIDLLPNPEYTAIFADLLERAIATAPCLNRHFLASQNSELMEKLLILSYGFVGINQTVIGEIAGIKQYDISRKYLPKIRAFLINNLAEWARQNPRTELDLKIITNLGDDLELLLKMHFRQQVVHSELEKGLRSHPNISPEITTLATYFRALPQNHAQRLLACNLAPAVLDQIIAKARAKLAKEHGAIAQLLKIEEQELVSRINALISEFILHLSQWLIEKFNLSSAELSKINCSLERAVYSFLCNAKYSLFMN